jgi:hypothetical protein
MHPETPQQATSLQAESSSPAVPVPYPANHLDFLEPDTRPQAGKGSFYLAPSAGESSLINKIARFFKGENNASKRHSAHAVASIEQLDSYIEQNAQATTTHSNQYSPETHNAQEASLNVIFSVSPAEVEKGEAFPYKPTLEQPVLPSTPAEEAWLNTKKPALPEDTFTSYTPVTSPVVTPAPPTQREPRFKVGGIQVPLNPAQEAITDIRPLADQQAPLKKLASASRRLSLPEQGLEVPGYHLEAFSSQAQESINPELLEIEVTDMVAQLQRRRFRQIAERNRKMRQNMNSMIEDYFANSENEG